MTIRRPAIACATAFISLLVAGCGVPDQPAPAPAVMAPRPQEYTCAQLQQAAQEFEALPARSMLRVLIGDSGQLRRELRAALGLPDPPKCPPPAPATTS